MITDLYPLSLLPLTLLDEGTLRPASSTIWAGSPYLQSNSIFKFMGSIRKIGNDLFMCFLDLFLRKGGEKRKVTTYRSYVPSLYNLLD